MNESVFCLRVERIDRASGRASEQGHPHATTRLSRPWPPTKWPKLEREPPAELEAARRTHAGDAPEVGRRRDVDYRARATCDAAVGAESVGQVLGLGD